MRHICICLAAAALASPTYTVEAQQPSTADRVRGALNLPTIIDSVRKRGGSREDEMRAVIEEARRRQVPASETHEVLKEADAAIKEHGPVDNFGAFVQGRLAAGLRGRALAQAIRAEHAQRGIGGGRDRGSKGAAKQDSIDRGRGKAGAAEKRPESPGSQKGGARDATTKGQNKGKGRP